MDKAVHPESWSSVARVGTAGKYSSKEGRPPSRSLGPGRDPRSLTRRPSKRRQRRDPHRLGRSLPAARARGRSRAALGKCSIGLSFADLDSDAKFFYIGRLLGHRRVETTARYAHLARDSIRESAERIAVSIAADIL